MFKRSSREQPRETQENAQTPPANSLLKEVTASLAAFGPSMASPIRFGIPGVSDVRRGVPERSPSYFRECRVCGDILPRFVQIAGSDITRQLGSIDSMERENE